ncbi:MAG: hypothetical protein K9M15_02990 [Candidatus Marinimicrobia bacterium]|nr:hypothetical protein [Candidatus Neomarinimicrobiota bacterium]
MNINHFKQKLEEEKKQLESGLSNMAHPDKKDPDDWKTDPEELNVMVSDKNELSDVFEESANKEAIEVELEERLNRVKSALKRIEDGTYGKCKEGCDIEEERLEANPAAETCIEHAKNA